MHHFAYRGGVLHAEDVSFVSLADAIDTPFYCYSTATLERHYRVLQEAFAGLDPLICYALKANSTLGIARLLRSLGAAADAMLIELRKIIPAFLTRVDQPDRGGKWTAYLAETRARTAENHTTSRSPARPARRPPRTWSMASCRSAGKP